jgi:hypothetical protein
MNISNRCNFESGVGNQNHILDENGLNGMSLGLGQDVTMSVNNEDDNFIEV